jgi:hypothetical protein
MQSRKLKLLLSMALALSGGAQAALVDRGGGMIYDTTLNLTWLADMNYALTSGFATGGVAPGSIYGTNTIWTDGRMGWDAANNWASNLSYGGFDDWRLPTLNSGDTSCGDNFNPGGGFPQQYYGYNCTGGEMSHLFVADLGNNANDSVLDQAGDTAEQIANLALFSNVQSYAYWSGLDYAPDTGNAWDFLTGGGNQGYIYKRDALYVLAVRAGDVADVPGPPSAIPEPGALSIVLTALGLLGGLTRRRKSPAA